MEIPKKCRLLKVGVGDYKPGAIVEIGNKPGQMRPAVYIQRFRRHQVEPVGDTGPLEGGALTTDNADDVIRKPKKKKAK